MAYNELMAYNEWKTYIEYSGIDLAYAPRWSEHKFKPVTLEDVQVMSEMIQANYSYTYASILAKEQVAMYDHIVKEFEHTLYGYGQYMLTHDEISFKTPFINVGQQMMVFQDTRPELSNGMESQRVRVLSLKTYDNGVRTAVVSLIVGNQELAPIEININEFVWEPVNAILTKSYKQTIHDRLPCQMQLDLI